MKHPRPPILAHQRGATLVITLVMLILILMLAVTGMRSTTIETRIAAHMLEYRQLFEVADGTLRDGERAIVGGNWQGVPLEACANGATPLDAHGTPCWTSQAHDLGTQWTQVAQASGFSKPNGYWYPRYIGSKCPKGTGDGSSRRKPTSGCSEYYEVNAQATRKDSAQDCGPHALCLRSSIHQFLK